MSRTVMAVELFMFRSGHPSPGCSGQTWDSAHLWVDGACGSWSGRRGAGLSDLPVLLGREPCEGHQLWTGWTTPHLSTTFSQQRGAGKRRCQKTVVMCVKVHVIPIFKSLFFYPGCVSLHNMHNMGPLNDRPPCENSMFSLRRLNNGALFSDDKIRYFSFSSPNEAFWCIPDLSRPQREIVCWVLKVPPSW